MDRTVFGSEAPGSGRHVIPETGRTGDDLVPVIDSFSFLTQEDKLQILNDNPKTVFPALARFDPAASRQAVRA